MSQILCGCSTHDKSPAPAESEPRRVQAVMAAYGRGAAVFLSKEELSSHLQRIGLPEAGVQFVVAAVEDPPGRKVRNRRFDNLIGELASPLQASFSSEGTAWRLQFESLSGEYAYATLLLHDPDVLLLLDQPTAVSIVVHDRLGRKRRTHYTADFLVVFKDRVCVVQVKPKAALEKLATTKPQDWAFEPTPRHLPADTAFARYGIEHKVVASESISWLRVQNFALLGPYRNPEAKCGLRQKVAHLTRLLEPCSLNALKEALSLPTVAPILCAIGSGDVYADLDHVALWDPNSEVICATVQKALDVGTAIRDATQETASKNTVKADVLCPPQYLKELVFRLELVKGESPTDSDRSSPSKRTILRWRRQFASGGHAALIPKWSRCGVKTQRSSVAVLENALDQIRLDRANPERPTRLQSHEAYCAKMLADHPDETPLSYSWFCELWSRRKHSVEDAYGVGGRRLANAAAPYKDVDSHSPLATRPFSVGHIDHCLAPILLADSKGRSHTVWVTLMVDDFTGEPLAVVIRKQPPSFEANALLLRDCVRRHGRLPAMIATDGGADFTGTQFRACLAQFGIDWIKAPAAKPRVRHVVERLFGTFASVMCRGRPGYIPNIKNLREVSKSKLPANLGKSPLEPFVEDVKRFFLDLIANRPRKHRASPAQERVEFEATYGSQGIPASLQLPEMIATAVPIKNPTGTSNLNGAVRLLGERFYSTRLSSRTVSVAKLAPRIDPEDRTLLYFYLENEWHIAKSGANQRSRGRDVESVNDEQGRSSDLHAGSLRSDHADKEPTAERPEPPEASTTPEADQADIDDSVDLPTLKTGLFLKE